MKANDIIKTLLVAGVALVGLSSCQERLIRFTKGEAVKFTAGSAGLTTKATYGEPEEQKVGATVPIYWEEGDLVRIFCEECGSPEIGDSDSRYADYVVTGFGETMSQAHLAQQTETILRWGGEKKHNFYAVYPTPDVSDGISYFPSMTQHKDKLKLTASVPKTIAAAQAVEGVIKADFKYQYMVAKTIADGWSDDNIGVFLTFKPLVTAVNFTIKNGTGKQLDIVGIGLESADNKISGEFTANLKDWDPSAAAYPSCVSGGTGDKVVQLSFAGYEGGHIALEEDATLNFTMFMAPCTKDVADLTFKVYKDDNTWVSTKLAYNDALKTGVVFPNHKMTYVTGLLVPDGAQWTVKYSADVDSWTDDPSVSKDPMPELKPGPFVTPWVYGGGGDDYNTQMLKYNYTLEVNGEVEFGKGGTAGSTLGIVSKRAIFLSDYYTDNIPVVWHMEYMDANGNWLAAKAGELIGNLITLNPVHGTGEVVINPGDEIELSGSQNITMTVAPASTPTSGKTHTEVLQDAAPKGADNAPYDLSMYDIYGNPRPAGKPVTANSYVINASGWYALPLVYGNGIDFNKAPAGGLNTPAYNPGGELSVSPTFLPRFHNAKAEPISSPYIDTDIESSAWSAAVLWQDASLITTGTEEDYKHCFVVDASTAKNTYKLSGMDGNCGYLIFQINTTLEQGNAVIAVKDAGGKVVWSWHIWVTDRDLSCNENGMMPFDLGWVDGNTGEISYYEGASVRLRAVQSSSKMIKEFMVTRREESSETSEQRHNGSSPFWQWGRKDPFYRTGDVTPESGSHDIAYSIQNPDKFISYIGDQTLWYNQTASGQPATFRNLWSATNQGNGSESAGYSRKPTKTIYDPCPPGFQVPQGNAFTTFDSSTANSYLDKSGFRNYGGVVSEFNATGYYWTAVPSTTVHSGVSMKFIASSVSPTESGAWSLGYSIRPVKE